MAERLGQKERRKPLTPCGFMFLPSFFCHELERVPKSRFDGAGRRSEIASDSSAALKDQRQKDWGRKIEGTADPRWCHVPAFSCLPSHRPTRKAPPAPQARRAQPT